MKRNRPAGRRALRVLLVTLIALVGGFAYLISSAYKAPASGTELSLGAVYTAAKAGEIRSAVLKDEDAQITGRRCAVAAVAPPVVAPVDPAAPPVVVVEDPIPALPPCSGPQADFHASYPRSDVSTQQLIDRIAASGAKVAVDKQTSTAVTKLIVTFVFPLLLLANLFGLIFVSKGGDSSLADIAGFGSIGRKRARKRRAGTGVSFADVAGADEAVAELREVTEYLRDPKKFQAYGATAPKGVLLFGQPGCGKTLLARAVAGESGVPFFSISGAEFVESLVGVGAARVRDLFRQVRDVAPAIVFIDEIDAVGRRRAGEGSSGGEREQTVNQLLVEMDGFEVSAGIVLMGATNRPDILDPALLRPGRFDRHVTLEPPDVHGREAILALHARAKPMAPEVDFAYLAKRTSGFTGADLANVVNEAALLSIREGSKAKVGNSQLAEAVQRVLHGPQRRGRIMSTEERRRIAYHEAGHAVMAAACGHAEEVVRVSVVARGSGLGQSMVDAESDRVLFTRTEMEARLAMAMGGIAAEEMVLGQSSTTAADDIERACGIAKEMVGLYGMSVAVGRLHLLSKDNGYLGTEVALDTASGPTLAAFDVAVKELVETAEARAKAVLERRRPQLEAMADKLDQDETLEGSLLQSLLAKVEVEADLFALVPSATTNGNGKPRPRRSPATKADRR